MMWRLLKFLTLVLLATVHAQDNKYSGQDIKAYPDYEYDDPEGLGPSDAEEGYETSEFLPTFLAPPQTFNVEVGGDITFPCDIQDIGDHVLMFKHILTSGENRMMYVGNTRVMKKSKKLVKQGNTFVLSRVRKHHAGQWVCRVESVPAVELNHTLHVQYPAIVQRVSPAIQHVVAGSSVTLQCNADGNPTAAISWSRRQGHLPSGQQSVEGLSITLENVDRYVEGTYICTASNGIGLPSSAEMTIEVEYPPEIKTEQAILHTGEGDEAKLICIVHGRPTPSIAWTKNKHPVNNTRHTSEHDSLHRHTLTIRKVLLEDFGLYTCTAENTLGQSSSTLRLTGLPKPPRMTSSPSGGEKTSYTLTWETESYTPVSMYRLQYRKYKGNQTGQSLEGWNVRLHSPEDSSPRTLASSSNAGPKHFMTHAIKDLEAATDYEARVAVENKFGWSNDSEIFRFYTRKEDPTTTTSTTTTTLPPPIEKSEPVKKEVAYQSSAVSGGCAGLTISFVVLALTLAATLS